MYDDLDMNQLVSNTGFSNIFAMRPLMTKTVIAGIVLCTYICTGNVGFHLPIFYH